MTHESPWWPGQGTRAVLPFIGLLLALAVVAVFPAISTFLL